MTGILRLRSPLVRSAHGFFGRTGGVSAGLYASLNVGLGGEDGREAVAENRARAVALAAPGTRLVTVCQEHGRNAVEAGFWEDGARPRADALVTDRPGLALGIVTADCAPVLFEDAEAGVIGAAHAGWRGALAGVIGATIEAMERLGAARERVAAAVGPCIGRKSYEVDDAFHARFVAADSGNGRFFAAGRPGHFLFDLAGYCLARLGEAGVGRAEWIAADTFAEGERFFSYRRSTLVGEAGYGRQLSLVALLS